MARFQSVRFFLSFFFDIAISNPFDDFIIAITKSKIKQPFVDARSTFGLLPFNVIVSKRRKRLGEKEKTAVFFASHKGDAAKQQFLMDQ